MRWMTPPGLAGGADCVVAGTSCAARGGGAGLLFWASAGRHMTVEVNHPAARAARLDRAKGKAMRLIRSSQRARGGHGLSAGARHQIQNKFNRERSFQAAKSIRHTMTASPSRK